MAGAPSFPRGVLPGVPVLTVGLHHVKVLAPPAVPARHVRRRVLRVPRAVPAVPGARGRRR